MIRGKPSGPGEVHGGRPEHVKTPDIQARTQCAAEDL